MRVLMIDIEYTKTDSNGVYDKIKFFKNEKQVYDCLYSLLKNENTKEIKSFEVLWFVNPFEWITYTWDGKSLKNKYGRTLMQDKNSISRCEYDYECSIKYK